MSDDRRHLVRIGLAPARATQVAATFGRCNDALDTMGADPHHRHSAWIPGRVELLGRHADVVGGRALLCAIDRGFAVRVATRTDAIVRAIDTGRGESCEFPLDPDAADTTGTWARHIARVARRMARNFPEARRGVDIAFASDLPVAAGLSSSSALMIAVSVALAKSNDLGSSESFRSAIATREELASYLGAVESGGSFRTLAGDAGAATFGGCADHVAILCSEPRQVGQWAFSPVRREAAFAFPAAHVLVIAASGVLAEESQEARDAHARDLRAVQGLLEAWNAEAGTRAVSLGEALRGGADAATRLAALAARLDASGALGARLEHLRLEAGELVPAAGRALAAGDLAAFAEAAAGSHAAAGRLLGTQVPETDALVTLALEHGAIAASAFGAGFGGSVWALVAEGDARRFTRAWHAAYGARYGAAGARSAFFISPAGSGAQQW